MQSEEDAFDRLVAAVGRESSAWRGFAGFWLEDERGIRVATTTDAVGLHAHLRTLAPDADLTVVTVAHSSEYLEALVTRVLADAERLGAIVAAVGITDSQNVVDVMLHTSSGPAGQELVAGFASEPIAWSEGSVVAT